MVVAAGDAHGQTRPAAGNELENAHVTGAVGAERVVDGSRASEGAPWNSPHAVVIPPDGYLDIWPPSPVLVRSLRLQADNDDQYVVEALGEDGGWHPLGRVTPVRGAGLRTRTMTFSPRVVRALRIRGAGGDGRYSIAEVHASADALPPRPSDLGPGHRPEPRYLTQARLGALKVAIAVVGIALFAWGWGARRAGRVHVHRRARDAVLVLLAAGSLAAWWNFFELHAGKLRHSWEHYHYYIGSKYVRELEYTRLYACVAVADGEDGLIPRPELRRLRNLETNEIEDASRVLATPSACKDRFTEHRWEEFKQDVRWFREDMPPELWARAQYDHGYNATPAWSVIGSTLSRFTSASERTINWLACIDIFLLAGAFTLAWWAFGWRALCVALIWWGTNYPARYFWVGGGYLRHDWLALTIIALALARRRWMIGAGAAITYAALLRIFPGVLVAGLVLKVAGRMWRERRWALSSQHKRFALGCVLAVLVVVPLSAVTSGGLDSWAGFVANSAKHLDTPLTNNMGLKTVVTYEHERRASRSISRAESDPYSAWKQARRASDSQRKVVFYVLIAVFLGLLAVAVRDQPDWVALALGVGLIPVAVEITCYYYSVLLVYGLLARRAGEALALAVSALAAATHLIALLWDWYDEIFTWMSLLIVVFVVLVTAGWSRLRVTPHSLEEP